MELTTNYLGLKLRSPLMPGASPMIDDLDIVRRLEDAGAGAIVMHSLFEEQLVGEQLSAYMATELHDEAYGEALSYLPESHEYHLGPDEYLKQIEHIKAACNIPVIASLNGSTTGGWLLYARQIAEAGADALELNIYDLVLDADEDGSSVEKRVVDIVREVRKVVNIPLAVKLAPYYTALAQFAKRLCQNGADGLVLFNRLYQPDIDIEDLEMIRVNPVGLGDLPLRLRWLGTLHGRCDCSLAASGGITTAGEAIKAIMAGADAVQMVSALLLNGPSYISQVEQRIIAWMQEHEYTSLDELRGSMSLTRCPDATAYKRANYMRTLLSWRM